MTRVLPHQTMRQIANAAKSELARRSFLDFCRLLYPGFQSPLHIVRLARILEQVERGELNRVIVSPHPGSGKSTLLQLFCAWALGRNSKRQIVATSAAERLVKRNGRAVRDLIGEPAWPFATTLAEDSTAAGLWETSDGGGLFGVGVGGVVTGWRASLGVCDDLEDGQSSRPELDSLEDWFRGKLLTRLEPDAPLIVVQTRWPNDDLPRRLMNGPRGEQWAYVRMPALAEEDDELGRKIGEALWPERYDVKALEDIREDIGSRHFSAQYQGKPMNDGGNILKSEWFGRYETLPDNFRKVVAGLDAAAKTGVRHDFSAIVVVGVTATAYYVLDVIRRREEFPGLIRMVKAAHERHNFSALYSEDTSNGLALNQQLKVEGRLPIVPVKPVGSKESRVEAISGTCEAGKVFLPKSAPWLADFENELCEFPMGDHDDMLDAFTMALARLSARQTWSVESIDFEDESPFRRIADPGDFDRFFDAQIETERTGKNRPEVVEQYLREKERRAGARAAAFGKSAN